MPWYFMRGEERIGPLDAGQFQQAVSTGVITSETYVWSDGMANWQKYGSLQPQAMQPALAPESGMGGLFACAECGGFFSADEMVQYGNTRVCATCKPIFFQRVQEGSKLPGTVIYGGFWIRFVAKFVDGLLLQCTNWAIIMLFGINMIPTVDPNTINVLPDQMIKNFLTGTILWVLGAAYTTFFLGYFGATPGKMAMGLRVVRPDGDKITYVRAFCRHLAEMVSGITLCLGYLMAAFDDEKRTLHDRMVDTRVIRK